MIDLPFPSLPLGLNKLKYYEKEHRAVEAVGAFPFIELLGKIVPSIQADSIHKLRRRRSAYRGGGEEFPWTSLNEAGRRQAETRRRHRGKIRQQKAYLADGGEAYDAQEVNYGHKVYQPDDVDLTGQDSEGKDRRYPSGIHQRGSQMNAGTKNHLEGSATVMRLPDEGHSMKDTKGDPQAKNHLTGEYLLKIKPIGLIVYYRK